MMIVFVDVSLTGTNMVPQITILRIVSFPAEKLVLQKQHFSPPPIILSTCCSLDIVVGVGKRGAYQVVHGDLPARQHPLLELL